MPHRPTGGSLGGAVSYERGTPVPPPEAGLSSGPSSQRATLPFAAALDRVRDCVKQLRLLLHGACAHRESRCFLRLRWTGYVTV
ncbi:hypothetical protein T484DRAFT_3293036 [Baffinella frigidus]|nr:hypothetical protein T484DRAFT_3293036 [Cryptophyta sp. CCMP2293]